MKLVIDELIFSLLKLVVFCPFSKSSPSFEKLNLTSPSFEIEFLCVKKNKFSIFDLELSKLPSKFTLSQLQYIYEILLDEKLDKRNFRKQAKNNEALKVTNEKQKGVSHKPARLYTFKDLN